MKKHIQTIALILAIVLACVSLYMNYNLSNEIDSLKLSLNNSVNSLTQQISGIYNNVDEKLEEKASILEKSSYEYGKPDIAGGTVAIDFSILPKEYTSATKAEIVLDGVSYPLELKNGSYTGSVTVSLYEEYMSAMDVVLTDGENIRTETPDWSFSPVGLLGQININDNDLSMHGKYEKNEYVSTLSGVLEVQFYCKKDIASLKELWLVHEVDGEVKSRTPIELNTTAPSGATLTYEVGEDDSEYSNKTYYYETEQNFKAPYNSVQVVYVEAVDSNGLRYRTAVGEGTITRKVVMADAHSWDSDYHYTAKIVDSSGKILWESI